MLLDALFASVLSTVIFLGLFALTESIILTDAINLQLTVSQTHLRSVEGYWRIAKFLGRDIPIKVVDKDLEKQHELFLVGRQSVSICDIIDISSKRGSLNLRINQKADKTYLHIENTKVRKAFDWEPKHILR